MTTIRGISINSQHRGLFTLDDDLLATILKSGKITDHYHVEQTPFARGSFATVRKCTHKVTNIEYAAKFVRKRRRSMDQRNEIYHEIAVLKLSEGCSNIVDIHEVYETSTEIVLVLELVAGGELQRVIDINDGLDENQVIQVLNQILQGVQFLHSNNIAHLDLKPQNLLITSTFPCDIKLCDFGISRVIEDEIELREILGTPDYVAPEILNYEPISLATDVWSIGVLAYVLLSGYSPFAGDTKQETFCNISQCSLSFPQELFERVSSRAKDFIMATLVQDARQRLTIQECFEHPWLKQCSPESGIGIIDSNITVKIRGDPLNNITELRKCINECDEENGDTCDGTEGMKNCYCCNDSLCCSDDCDEYCNRVVNKSINNPSVSIIADTSITSC